ncbi:MAG: hypothetical protein JWM80_4870 [Cyanobacteria bacterium RYN_339]|nr:hypothetical protein [Cyanobacteria bacterium RYN_339]
MQNFPWTSIALLVLFVTALAIMGPRIWALVGPRFGKFAGEAYQKRFFKQLQKKYPVLAVRIEGFEMGPANQEAFQSAIKRLPPQRAMELQTEFNRLRENFMQRHPELVPVFEAGQDPRAQAKAMDAMLKFPEDKRKAIEKDVIWAWDQLRGRYPAMMGPLEQAFKKKAAVVEQR